MKQMNSTDFAAYLARARSIFKSATFKVSEKPLNYGWQIIIDDDGKRAFVSIYNGKKGLTHVFNGDKNLTTKLAKIINILNEQQDVNEDFPFIPSSVKLGKNSMPYLRAGSDESGKGDFFGSLVVAATVVDREAISKLNIFGVKDCKLLADKKILELEKVIKDTVLAYSVLDLKPKFYNQRYREIIAAGGKLNQLLASGHIRALSQVLQQQPECKYAIIDQFTQSKICIIELKKKFPQCEVFQMPRAEVDMAVAAASVLARARFLHTMKEMSDEVGVLLPKGSGSIVTETARNLAARIGKEALENYVKIHFANYRRL